MDAAEKHRRNFVARLASENQEFYGRTEGRGVLRALELTFEHEIAKGVLHPKTLQGASRRLKPVSSDNARAPVVR